MLRKLQRHFLSGKHAKAYLILGIFPLMVFIMLFAKLNFKFSIVDEEFFSATEGDEMESDLMKNTRVLRHVIRKSHNGKLKKHVAFGYHNRLEKLNDEKQVPEFEILKKSEVMELGPPDVTSSLSNKRNNGKYSQNTHLTHTENMNYKKFKVSNESNKRSYATQNYNSHIKTQIEKPFHFQKHFQQSGEKPTSLQKIGYEPNTRSSDKVKAPEIFLENTQDVTQENKPESHPKIDSKTQQKGSEFTDHIGQLKTLDKTAHKIHSESVNRKEIIQTHPGLFIEIPERLQCNETTKTKMMRLLPNTYLNSNKTANRILVQMDHVPTSNMSNNEAKPKMIYFYGSQRVWSIPEGKSFFQQCKVQNCIATYDRSLAPLADAVVLGNQEQLPRRPPFQKKSRNQIWAFSMIETPPNTKSLKPYRGLFNWTLTYRHDSVIPTPYFQFRYFSNSSKLPSIQIKNYAEGKTKKVAIFVSNCGLVRSGRTHYIKALAKHIDVDIFGRCGKHKCSKRNNSKCMQMLKKDYKFYLAFENSKCEDYMTEKVTNACHNDVIPIVLGASRDTYKQALPPGSYIHTEDFLTPKDLAEFLHKLDQDDSLFNEYFRWKQQGEFINIQTWCRMCSLLNEELLPRVWYDEIEKWWRPDNVCIGESNWAH